MSTRRFTSITTPAATAKPTVIADGAGDPVVQKTPAADVTTPAFLGLRFDERRRLVTRDGYDGVKTSLLDRPQLWDLLFELVAAGDAPLERGELAAGCRKRAWKGREANDENVLRSALTALRSRLKPLGVDPRSVRDVGVWLQEIKTKRRVKPKKGRPKRPK